MEDLDGQGRAASACMGWDQGSRGLSWMFLLTDHVNMWCLCSCSMLALRSETESPRHAHGHGDLANSTGAGSLTKQLSFWPCPRAALAQDRREVTPALHATPRHAMPSCSPIATAQANAKTYAHVVSWQASPARASWRATSRSATRRARPRGRRWRCA